MPVNFVFDPLVGCDSFVKFLEMAERNHGKSSVPQRVVVQTLSLADDGANPRVESADKFVAGS